MGLEPFKPLNHLASRLSHFNPLTLSPARHRTMAENRPSQRKQFSVPACIHGQRLSAMT